MTVEAIREHCLSLAGTTESIKWDDHLCFCIGDKMYMVLSPDHFPVSCSFKTTPELFAELTTRKGIIPAPYMARNMWVHADDINRLTLQEWIEFSTIAYKLVFEKLPAKTKKLLAGV